MQKKETLDGLKSSITQKFVNSSWLGKNSKKVTNKNSAGKKKRLNTLFLRRLRAEEDAL